MSDSAPLVSVVTPSFNQAKFLEETMISVLSQDYPHIEYIVIDGGSTDGTLEIIERHAARLAHWISEPDRGQADAINSGFAAASGEILAWLNSDDTYNPGAVSEAVAFLRSNPDVGMVYGNAYYIDQAGVRIGRYPARQTDYEGLRRGINTVCQQSMFFRTSLWKEVGPLDPSFYYAMDYDLWVRLAAAAPIVFQDRYWANFRLHPDSKSLTAAYRCWPEIMKVHFRDGGSVFSVIYAKYLLRRLLEPVMPLRMKMRIWRFSLERAVARQAGSNDRTR
jgi:glycosyltransferase involved in cell wall biosynthesis